ncbi:MAG: RDD family protein [Anaerolineae bacterium]|jgi:uncharacterized RDD family membrane protein YckC
MANEPAANPSTARAAEGISGQYAGFVTRAIAFYIDRLIVAAIVAVVTVAIGFAVQFFRLSELLSTQDLVQTLVGIVAAVLAGTFDLFYCVGFWMLAGQTPGKRLMGLVVIKSNGSRIGLGAALLRWVGYWLSGILFLGYLWVLVDNRRQALHDKLAGTLVVYSRPEEMGLAASTPARDRLRGLGREHEAG